MIEPRLSCFGMQHESVVAEDDIVHYSIFVDEFIHLGKDSCTDELRAAMIDCLAFMYAHFHIFVSHRALVVLSLSSCL